MTEIRRTSDIFSTDEKRYIIDQIIRFFEEERDEEIGMIAAEQILNFFLDTVGKELLNHGRQEVKDLMASKFTDIELDIEALLQQ
ncbi:DUF2164 domain-containing protein [Patescibacteria group bacterium]|nr:DUF2164 domain-containing protein [Patescibacteria group bacterium]MBU1722049.1 DUF2164 domain-containing protein [Patescibacteria group bacterium]MBU1901519.1 DUF2164 domain-containing protein [Patescibacteria group bacterium]